MKARYILAVLMIGSSACAMAQENDDMYFNSKDRAALNSNKDVILAKIYGQEDQVAIRTNPVNPSDSYSGRGVNPEYNAQAKNGTKVVQSSPDYFLTGYSAKNVNSNLYNGNGNGSYSSPYYGNSAYNNSSYGMNGYNGYGMNSMYGMSGMYSPYNSMYGMSSMYGMYSPYSMGSMYSPYSMMGMGGMYSPYGYGMSGMSMGMGFGSMYGMGMSSYMMMGYGYGSMYGYPSVIVTGDGSGYSTGRHATRSTSLNNSYANPGRHSSVASTSSSPGARTAPGGRTSSSQTNYYDRGWRNNASNFTSSGSAMDGRGGNSNGWNNGGSGFSGGRQSQSSWGNMGGSSFGGARSSGFSGGGGGGGAVSHGRH